MNHVCQGWRKKDEDDEGVGQRGEGQDEGGAQERDEEYALDTLKELHAKLEEDCVFEKIGERLELRQKMWEAAEVAFEARRAALEEELIKADFGWLGLANTFDPKPSPMYWASVASKTCANARCRRREMGWGANEAACLVSQLERTMLPAMGALAVCMSTC